MQHDEKMDLLSKMTTSTDLQPKDCEPMSIGNLPSNRPSPPEQRSVFPAGSEWASPTTRTILDAFKESFSAQVEGKGLNQTVLSVMRSCGAIEVDPSVADFFDTGAIGSVNACTASAGGGGEKLVQCKACHRPVLMTRILAHVKRCNALSKEGGDHVSDESDTDPEMHLICPSLEVSSHQQDASRTPPKTPTPESQSSSDAACSMSGKQRSNEPRVSSFVGEEDDWRARIVPVVPRYVPRGATSKRRRVAISTPHASPSQRKKNIAIERKALAAAASAGLGSVSAQHSKDAPEAGSEPLRVLAERWGAAAPWSQLMQVALPLVIPRNPRRKTPTVKDSPSGSSRSSFVPVNGASSAGSNSAKSGGKPTDHFDKQNAPPPPGPSLLGSLLWLRGRSIKQLADTSLSSMDIPQMPIARSGPIFPGQKHIAPAGTFASDPRLHSSIKMPIGGVSQMSAVTSAQNRAAPPTRPVAAEARTKQGAAQPSTGATTSGSSQAPPPKRQRTSKQQRSQGALTKAQQVAQARQAPAAARQAANIRVPAGVPAGRGALGAQEALQRMQQRNVAQAPKGVHAVNPVMAGGQHAAAAKYAASQAMQQQKKVFRAPVVANATANRLPHSAVQVSPAPQSAGGHPTASKSNVARPMKGRPHSHAGVGSASPSMRSTGSMAVTSQSPGQHSSRSTDRTPMRNGPAVSQYDPTLLATAAAVQAASGGNRGGAMHPNTGNPQYDFQQVVAQMTAAQGAQNVNREDMFDPTRGLVPGVGAPQQADNAGMQQLRGQGMRGLSPHARLKQQVAVQSAAQRGTVLKQRAPQRMRKDDRELKKTPTIGQQLQQAEALQANGVAAKLNAAVNNASHGFYSAALAAAGQNGGPGPGMKGPGMKGQPNMAVLRMAHQSQNRIVPGPHADPTSEMLQNVHDVRQLQNMSVMPGMRGAAPTANVLGLLQATGLNGGFQNAGMAAGPGQALGGNVIAPGQNPNLLTNDTILEQLLSTRNHGVNPNPMLHAQHLARVSAQLGQVQPLARTAGLPLHAVAPQPPSSNAALAEIDRALGIAFNDEAMK